MKNKKNKGFTLIELLAVIVILGVLLSIAIPAVTKYINTAKKSTYKENVQSFAKSAKNEFMNIDSKYQLPINAGDAVVVTFDELEDSVENGGKKSSYNNKWDYTRSCVVIINDGETNDPHYTYYIAARDEKGYSIGYTTTAQFRAYDDIENENIIQTSGKDICCTSKDTMTTDIPDLTGKLYDKDGHEITTPNCED